MIARPNFRAETAFVPPPSGQRRFTDENWVKDLLRLL